MTPTFLRTMKSERLKKLESELHDLEQWLKLGLVPKKELEKHRDEIQNVRARIQEEKERLQFLKESGEGEDYVTPRRTPGKSAYPETPTFSEMEMGDDTEAGLDIETESMEFETSATEEETSEETSEEGGGGDSDDEEEEEDPFSDQNRWRRGGIIDPDANEW